MFGSRDKANIFRSLLRKESCLIAFFTQTCTTAWLKTVEGSQWKTNYELYIISCTNLTCYSTQQIYLSWNKLVTGTGCNCIYFSYNCYKIIVNILWCNTVQCNYILAHIGLSMLHECLLICACFVCLILGHTGGGVHSLGSCDWLAIVSNGLVRLWLP